MGLPRYAAAAMAVWLTMPGLAAAQSTPATPAMASLQTMVSNLGYNVSLSSDGKSISFTLNGDYNYNVTIDLSQDEGTAYIFFQVMELTADQLKSFPLVKLLEFDDTTDAYFSMESNSGGESLYFDSFFSIAGLTPQILRDEISSFQNHADTSSSIWSSYLPK